MREGCEVGPHLLIGGGYRDELVRTSAGWRIQRRALYVRWQVGNPRVLSPRR